MTTPASPASGRIRKLLGRLMSSPTFWGIVGWALMYMRYASEVIHPRYGG